MPYRRKQAQEIGASVQIARRCQQVHLESYSSVNDEKTKIEVEPPSNDAVIITIGPSVGNFDVAESRVAISA